MQPPGNPLPGTAIPSAPPARRRRLRAGHVRRQGRHHRAAAGDRPLGRGLPGRAAGHAPLGLRGRRGDRQPRARRRARAPRGLLSAGDCLLESFVGRDDGRPEVAFGCRGLLAVELSVRLLETATRRILAVLRSPPWTLTRALTSLVDEDGNVLVDGFHDDVVTEPGCGRRRPPPRCARSGARSRRASGSARPDRRGARSAPLVHAERERLGARGRRCGERERCRAGRRARPGRLPPGSGQEPADMGRCAATSTPTASARSSSAWADGAAAPRACSARRWGRGARGRGRRLRGAGRLPQLPGARPARVMLDVLGATTVSPAGTTADRLHGPKDTAPWPTTSTTCASRCACSKSCLSPAPPGGALTAEPQALSPPPRPPRLRCSALQRSKARGQPWKRQPCGGGAGSGTSPGSASG